MRKLLMAVMSFLLVISMCGCGASSNDGKTSNHNKLGEKIDNNDFSVTVTKAEFTPAVETTLSDPNFYYPNPNEEKSFKGVDGKTYQSTGWASYDLCSYFTTYCSHRISGYYYSVLED